MNADQFGPPISLGLYLTGAWIGWRMSKLKKGEVSVPTQGLGRGASKPLRVFGGAFGWALLGVGLGFLAWHFDSTLLAYVAVAIVAPSIGVGHGAVMRGWLGFFRNRPS
jgi:hypothetical protein